jgi:sugar phosphate isomerase/epimerase
LKKSLEINLIRNYDPKKNMIYTSTSCLSNPKIVVKVLKEYEKAGIRNVELGSIHSHFNVSELKKFDFNFLIHNYFPAPRIPFNFNLASQNNSIRKKSINHAKNAINLCRQIDSPMYTFHGGFTVDPQKLGFKFSRKNISDKPRSIFTFIDSLFDIIDFAKSSGIKLAMEPNVVQKFNLTRNKNKLLLFAELKEIEILFNFFNKKELGILLDLGHTAVTSHWLHFNKNNFVKKLKDRISAIHISNNNGLQDQHKGLTKMCWQNTRLKNFKNIPIVLESMNLNIEDIKHNLQLIKESK